MARRQIEIPGTERDDVPPVLLEAGEKLLDLRREKRRIGDKFKEGKATVLHLMQMHKVPMFALKDPETDERMELELDMEPKLRTKKSGEVDSEVGDGVEGSGVPPSVGPGVPQGLIDQALAAQDEQNVEVSADGDVEVPDKPAPKKKRKGGAKKGKGGAKKGKRK